MEGGQGAIVLVTFFIPSSVGGTQHLSPACDTVSRRGGGEKEEEEEEEEEEDGKREDGKREEDKLDFCDRHVLLALLSSVMTDLCSDVFHA